MEIGLILLMLMLNMMVKIELEQVYMIHSFTGVKALNVLAI
jgi:hypothetical protein